MKTYENFITDLFVDKKKILSDIINRINKYKHELYGMPYCKNLNNVDLPYFLISSVKLKLHDSSICIVISDAQSTFLSISYINIEKYRKKLLKDDIEINTTCQVRVNDIIDKFFINIALDKYVKYTDMIDFDFKKYLKILIENYAETRLNMDAVYYLIFKNQMDDSDSIKELQKWILLNYPNEYDNMKKCLHTDIAEDYEHLKNELF